MTDPFKVPVCKCPACAAPLGFATNVVRDDAPVPGCFTICLECGHLMAFAEDLTLRDLTDAEQIKIAGDPVLLAMQRARGKVMGKRR
jgi:hypothetical protein